MPLPFFIWDAYHARTNGNGDDEMSAVMGLALLLLVAGEPDAASPPPSAEPGQADKAAADPNRVICRTVAETGSRLRRTRTCLTARDWDVQERARQQDLKNRPALGSSRSQ